VESPETVEKPGTEEARSGGLLNGMRVLVVGASSGIGRSLAIQATRSGATVAFAARRLDLLESAIETASESAIETAIESAIETASESASADSVRASARAFRCDVTDEIEVTRTVDEAVAWMGGLDVLVYCVGTARLGRIDELDGSDWSRLLATNVVGAAMVIRRALPALHKAENGTVTILSSHIVGNPWASLAAYSASKAALEELARGLRAEEPSLRVLSIRIGDTATGFADGWDHERFHSALGGWVEKGLMPYRVMSADEAAELVLKAVVDVAGPTELLVRGEEVHLL
jgi:NAD(P)-dependent dehydrogenase (short-subunit alcohol dehydrogenase family)